jgi:hypothetical protein
MDETSYHFNSGDEGFAGAGSRNAGLHFIKPGIAD